MIIGNEENDKKEILIILIFVEKQLKLETSISLENENIHISNDQSSILIPGTSTCTLMLKIKR
jgi:hypothetical protein